MHWMDCPAALRTVSMSGGRALCAEGQARGGACGLMGHRRKEERQMRGGVQTGKGRSVRVGRSQEKEKRDGCMCPANIRAMPRAHVHALSHTARTFIIISHTCISPTPAKHMHFPQRRHQRHVASQPHHAHHPTSTHTPHTCTNPFPTPAAAPTLAPGGLSAPPRALACCRSHPERMRSLRAWGETGGKRVDVWMCERKHRVHGGRRMTPPCSLPASTNSTTTRRAPGYSFAPTTALSLPNHNLVFA
eukprot:365967-Chlamydomonas_euryale.AAC.4